MNEKRKVLELLKEGTISIDKAENLLNQLSKPKEKLIEVMINTSDGERASFQFPFSILSLLKANIINSTTLNNFRDVMKEINWSKLFKEIERIDGGEIANIKLSRGDQMIINVK